MLMSASRIVPSSDIARLCTKRQRRADKLAPAWPRTSGIRGRLAYGAAVEETTWARAG